MGLPVPGHLDRPAPRLPGPPGGPTFTAEQAVYRPFLLAVGEAVELGLVSLEVNSHLAPGSVDGEALIVDQLPQALQRF
jgi:hypothetical protein